MTFNLYLFVLGRDVLYCLHLVYKLFHINYLKANHLVNKVSRWYGSQISADCQEKLFSLEHDIGGKISLVTFLEEQETEHHVQI